MAVNLSLLGPMISGSICCWVTKGIENRAVTPTITAVTTLSNGHSFVLRHKKEVHCPGYEFQN